MRLVASDTPRVSVKQRLLCPQCGRPMRKADVVNGRQTYSCAYCCQREGIWDGLDVVTELAPAVGGVRACQQRCGSVIVRCQYYAECQDNIVRGGAALCERVFVLDAGGQRVVM